MYCISLVFGDILQNLSVEKKGSKVVFYILLIVTSYNGLKTFETKSQPRYFHFCEKSDTAHFCGLRCRYTVFPLYLAIFDFFMVISYDIRFLTVIIAPTLKFGFKSHLSHLIDHCMK